MPMKPTPAFQQWFGDSKVVDDAGQPLVVYHGTANKFTSFNMAASLDGAHFFVADKDHATFFGAPADYYVSITNPMEISQNDLEEAWDAEHPDGDQDGRYLLPRNFVGAFVAKAKLAGHDGLIIRQMGDLDIEADMFLPFSPQQIKSADKNNGDFDKHNPDIRFSLVDDQDDGISEAPCP
jgi:hypothetical protein